MQWGSNGFWWSICRFIRASAVKMVDNKSKSQSKSSSEYKDSIIDAGDNTVVERSTTTKVESAVRTGVRFLI